MKCWPFLWARETLQLSNTKQITLTVEGEAGAGKSLLIRALALGLFLPMGIDFEQPTTKTFRGEHSVTFDLDDDDRNALADLIQMQESLRSN
jgi:GTPase SAR1 family protein